MSASLTGRNVILVVADSVRADIFEDEAPNFAALASDGLLFKRAVAPAAWTLPSHMSMFTGLAPSEHGAVATGGPKGELRAAVGRVVSNHIERGALLAPLLQERGVRTFTSTPNPWLGPLTGLNKGFDEQFFFGFLDDGGGPPIGRGSASGRLQQAVGVLRAMRRHARWVTSERDKGAARILASLEAFIDGSHEPFFAFVNLIEAHEPHIYPPTERRPREIEHLKASINAVVQPGPIRAQRVRLHNWGVREIPARLLKRWEDAYRAEIRYVDRWIARLTDGLAERRLLERTTVIVTSDHGENFGEKGIVGHGLSLENSTARVPLGLWGGDVTPSVVTEPVGLAAIRATVEDLLLDRGSEGSLVNPRSHGFASIEVEDPMKVNRPPRAANRRSLGAGAAFFDGDLKYVVDPFDGESLRDLGKDLEGRVAADSGTGPTPAQVRAKDAWEQRVSALG